MATQQAGGASYQLGGAGLGALPQKKTAQPLAAPKPVSPLVAPLAGAKPLGGIGVAPASQTITSTAQPSGPVPILPPPPATEGVGIAPASQTITSTATKGGLPYGTGATDPGATLGDSTFGSKIGTTEGVAIAPPSQTITSTSTPGIVPPPITTAQPSPITSFGPGNDLVSAQINPVASGRTGDTMGAVDAARNALTGGPNRSDLASQYIDQWNQSTEPQYQRDLTQATKLAAANGRIGSGMLTTDYGNIALARDNARQVAQRGFQTDALGGTIQDRLNNLGALSGLEGQQYGQDAANRNEVRGERGYQQGLSQQDFTNNAQRLALEEALTQGQYGRESNRLDQLIGLGYQGNPGALALGASGQVQSGANQSQQGLSDLLAQYFLGRGVGG